MDTVKEVLQGAAFVTGLLILFYTLFSYEDEEKKVKSWFEAALIALKKSDESGSVRIGAFIRKLLDGLNIFFKRIYGERLLSLRVISVGVCITTAIFISQVYSFGVVKYILIFWFLAAPFFRDDWFVNFAALYAVATFVIETYVSEGYPVRGLSWWASAMLLVAMLFEGLLIAAVRRLFKSATTAPTLKRMLFHIFAATLLTPAYLVAISSFVATWNMENRPMLKTMADWLNILSHINILPIATSMSFLVVLIFAIFLRILYALLPRVVGMPIKLNLLDNRKAAIGLAIALIGVSMPTAVGFMEKAAKVMGLG